MKILITTLDDYPHHGGKSTHISNLIAGLGNYGVDCEVLGRNEINALLLIVLKILIQPLKLFNIKHYLYWRKKCELFLYKVKLKKVLRNNNYDLISAQDALSCTLAGRLDIDIPIVLTMHTYYGLEYTLDNNYFSSEDKLYNKLLFTELESIKYNSDIIAVDERIKEHILSILKRNLDLIKKSSNVIAISNFTNTDIFSPCTSNNTINLKDYYISESDFVIICVRRLVEKNGVYFAVQAMKYIPENIQIKMLIVGDGPERSRIEKLIAENGLYNRVSLVGAINNEEMPGLYSKCNIALVPSITVNGLQEATSISAIESMSCGIPTIASNIGGLTELITNYDNGILVTERNSKEIAKAICELHNNPDLMDRISINSRKYIVNNHSHIAVSKKYLDVFKSVKRKA